MFFQETAEELVNRLYDDFLKSNTFAVDVPLLPEFRHWVIERLKKVDKMLAETENDGEEAESESELYIIATKNSIRLHRENYVLFDLAISYADLAKTAITSPPPKPTHRQQNRKYNHLRLVVNQ